MKLSDLHRKCPFCNQDCIVYMNRTSFDPYLGETILTNSTLKFATKDNDIFIDINDHSFSCSKNNDMFYVFSRINILVLTLSCPKNHFTCKTLPLTFDHDKFIMNDFDLNYEEYNLLNNSDVIFFIRTDYKNKSSKVSYAKPIRDKYQRRHEERLDLSLFFPLQSYSKEFILDKLNLYLSML